ncbi:MAG: hypothetical protein AAGI90_03280 [Chlamydiota bacterium]
MADVLHEMKKTLKKNVPIETLSTVSEHLVHFLQGDCSEDEREEAIKLLESVEKKREKLWEKDRKLAEKLAKLQIKADQTRSFLEKHTPIENEKKIEELYQAFSLLEKESAQRSYFLDAALESCFRSICRCSFYVQFPEAHLFDLGSYEKNIAHLLKELEEAFLQNYSNQKILWMQLPSPLRVGIEKAAQEMFDRSISLLEGEEKSYSVAIYTTDLQNVLHFSETFLYIDQKKALYEFQLLPMRIKSAISTCQEEGNLGEQAISYLKKVVYGDDAASF